jgi:RNA polymerase sigma-70 factor (ECF subfamily)
MTSADDRDAFAACFASSWPRVCRYLRSRGAEADTHDLASEVFTLAWQRWKRVPDDPLPWLLQTARHLLANHLRRQRHRSADPLDELTIADRRLSGDTLDQRRQARAVLAALAQLSPIDRESLLLIAWDELTPAQAARACGCSTATFRMRVHRARLRLRRRLAETPPPAQTLETACLTD